MKHGIVPDIVISVHVTFEYMSYMMLAQQARLLHQNAQSDYDWSDGRNFFFQTAQRPVPICSQSEKNVWVHFDQVFMCAEKSQVSYILNVNIGQIKMKKLFLAILTQ